MAAPQELLGALRRIREYKNRNYKEIADLAISYLLDRQLNDTRGQITVRYPRTQEGGSGQRIEAVTLPITQRYVAESASLYTHKVTRTVVDQKGNTNDVMTNSLNEGLKKANYDFVKQRLDQVLCLLGDCDLWFQIKNEKLHPVLSLPQNCIPLMKEQDGSINPSDQDDYDGFITELSGCEDKQQKEKTYAYVTAEKVYVYKAEDPLEPQGTPQPIDLDYTYQGKPLQMYTTWAESLPIDNLRIKKDPSVVLCNREINVQWSLLLYVMRLQGWDTTVITRLIDSKGAMDIPHGAGFPIFLQAGESLQKVGSSTPYESLVNVINNFLRMLAISGRLSPNDFSINGVSPASGFAKLMDSLPKIEAREEREAQLKRQEETVAWPRLAVIGNRLGWQGFEESAIESHTMSVEFAALKFPKTADEQIKEEDQDLKLGHTTEAKLLAQKKNIPIVQAIKEIEENKVSKTPEALPIQSSPQQPSSLLGALIAQPQARRS